MFPTYAVWNRKIGHTTDCFIPQWSSDITVGARVLGMAVNLCCIPTPSSSSSAAFGMGDKIISFGFLQDDHLQDLFCIVTTMCTSGRSLTNPSALICYRRTTGARQSPVSLPTEKQNSFQMQQYQSSTTAFNFNYQSYKDWQTHNSHVQSKNAIITNLPGLVIALLL